jgi:hypothetical protein
MTPLHYQAPPRLRYLHIWNICLILLALILGCVLIKHWHTEDTQTTDFWLLLNAGQKPLLIRQFPIPGLHQVIGRNMLWLHPYPTIVSPNLICWTYWLTTLAPQEVSCSIWPFFMDLLLWNVHGFHSRFPDLQVLIWYQDPAIVCLQKTHLHPSRTSHLCGYLADHYDHLDSDRANGGTAALVKDCISSTSVNLHSPLQATAIRLNLPHLPLTVCNIYLPPGVPIASAVLTNLISQLPHH